MERLYYVESPAQRRSASASAIAVHRAHLSHYISQLSALEREQQRLSLEQQLLSRQEAQLAAKRDQLTYLIAEEQDLVLRAIQQQQQQQRDEEEAILAVALMEREALIARRQKLRYAVYRKQQEEKARKDAQIERVLQVVQQQGQRSQPASPQQSIPFLQIQQQQQSHASPYGSDSELEETGVRPGSISSMLRQQGIKPHDLYSPYATPHSNRKRGSRRGPQQSTVSEISRLQAQEHEATSSKLIPDVNYASAQDFLSALFGGVEQAHPETDNVEPKVAGSKLDQPSTNQLSVDELARILFSSDGMNADRTSETLEPRVPLEPPAARQPFHYTLSRSSIPRADSPPLSVIPSPLEAIAIQIRTLHEKVSRAAAGIDTIPTHLPESRRRQALLDIQVELERCYSDLDDILISPAEGEEDDEETKEQRQKLRLQKHAVTTLAVDAADRIDKILSPASRSDSETEEEEEEEEYEVLPPVPAELNGAGPLDESTILIPSPFNQADLGTSSSSSSESTSVFGSEIATPKTQQEKAELASEKINEDGEFYVLGKRSAETSSAGLVNANEEKGMAPEDATEIKVNLTSAANASTGTNTPSTRDDDDSSVIVTASAPVIHDQTADEVFVPEGGDKSGHIVLEKNTGQEVEEFLDSEEKSEVKVSLSVKEAQRSVVDKVKSEGRSRSHSPLRHVVLEDVANDE
ncbi:uncharacterized protein V1513DRAFT_434732 [Lipomyces chichibuensis]|uniref:uncharacterized protein n=1 Tax=Lipomyces chichibuensis TaxID=1546026 RepID=UPI00334320F7